MRESQATPIQEVLPNIPEAIRSKCQDLIKQRKLAAEAAKPQLDAEFGQDLPLHTVLEILDCRQREQVCKECVGMEECKQMPRGLVTRITPYTVGGRVIIDKRYFACDYMMNRWNKADDNKRQIEASVPAVWRDKTFNDFKAKAANVEAIKVAKMGVAFYMYGPTGAGKSMLAAITCNAVLKTTTAKVMFVNVPELLEALRPNQPVTVDYDAVRRCDYLVLDDFSASTPWAAEQLLMLVDYRYRNKLTTSFTAEAAISADTKIGRRVTSMARVVKIG